MGLNIKKDIDSQINTGATSVWLNGTDISGQFTTSADGVSGQFDLFPVATLRGQNQIVVRVVNDSNAATKKTFHFTVDTAGTMLVVAVAVLGSLTVLPSPARSASTAASGRQPTAPAAICSRASLRDRLTSREKRRCWVDANRFR